MQYELRYYFKHGTIRQLNAFEAVARLGSFSLAAETLGLAQPTVSILIHKLADTIGMPLFHHIGKRVCLTEAGQRLYPVCQDIFTLITEFDRQLEVHQREESRRIAPGS